MGIKFIDLFETYKETDNSKTPNLTEERIYSFCQDVAKGMLKVPVFSGATLNRGVVGYVPNYLKEKSEEIKLEAGKINYYQNKEDCITIVADGNAGYMFYRKKEDFPLFCMNISSIAIFKKKDSEIKKLYPEFDGLNLMWFFLRFNNYFRNIVMGEGVQHFTKQVYEKIELDIPELKEQEKELVDYHKLYGINKILSKFREKLEELFSKHLSFEDYEGDEVSCEKVFEVTSGNSGLTEQYLYQKILEGDRIIDFLGGSLELEHMKIPLVKHPKKDDKINWINNKECLFVIRKGKAGLIKHLPKGNYTTNDDAYILSLTKEYANKIILKWVSYAYRDLFLEYSSSSDNGTWNKTNFMEYGEIKLISPEKQMEILKIYEKLEQIKNKVMTLEANTNNLLEKELSD